LKIPLKSDHNGIASIQPKYYCLPFTTGVISLQERFFTSFPHIIPEDPPGFPVRISQPGSYRLTSNLTVLSANTTVINIITNNVTIDLNGFSIIGVTACSGTPTTCRFTGTGVGVNAPNRTNITVINGVVRRMGSSGLFLGDNSHVEKVQAISNGFGGIRIGNNSIVTGSLAVQNGGYGISTNQFNTVLGNVVNQNKFGIFCHSCTVKDNTVISNGSIGVNSAESTVLGNTVSRNGSVGINCDGCTVKDNTVIRNGFHGISSFNSTVQSNTAFGNTGFGLDLNFQSGYSNNVLNQNNGGNDNAQVNDGIEIGTNLCGGDTICP
jgi:parallel beta-helix repeat protein